jgi:hypothetical protein
MIPWPPINLTCWKKKLKMHEEKQNQYFIENSKITRKKHILMEQISQIEKKKYFPSFIIEVINRSIIIFIINR